MMDDNAKKKIALAKKLIQEHKYQQALEDLEIMVYKYSKLFQIHLMTALCYTKLGKDAEAEKQYLEVLDLKADEPNAIRELCQIYTRKGDAVKSAKYLQSCAAILKKSDPKKYSEMVGKLINIYQKEDDLQKIDPIFQQYVKDEELIGEDFVRIAEAEFRVGVRNQCFNLQNWVKMGAKGEKIRLILPAARQGINRLLIEVSNYLRSVALQYHINQRELANSLVELHYYFPQAASVLMLMFFDEYCIGQINYSPLILSQILRLFQAYFDRNQNGFLNLQYTQNETFSVCMILSFEYLSFFKQFFTLDELLLPYLPRLAVLIQQIQSEVYIRQDYRKKIKHFLLKQCRQLNAQSRFQAVENRLQDLKSRILKLQGSFLEQVIAKIALNCVKSYQKVNDLKNMLKLRIRNIKEGDCVPHLYKYYYQYLIKIARVYKALDQEIPLIQILTYITTHDILDRKYHVQLFWLEFCLAIKDSNQGKEEVAKQCLDKLYKQEMVAEKQLKSVILRRIIILKVFLGDCQISNQISKCLQNERSFENLQCAGFYYYWKGLHKQAHIVLNEAFKLNRVHYHTNRLLFLCLLEYSQSQAIKFLDIIHDDFPNVFWINYLLGINLINNKRYQQGENLMSKSIQNFQFGVNGMKYYYQRVRNLGPFSIQYLIQQNQYSIFFEQVIFPQDYIYNKCKLISRVYFEVNIIESKIILYRKQGQILKILGRTKSALNYLMDGYILSSQLTIDLSNIRLILQICLLKKQYATLLFYMRKFKQSQLILDECRILLQQIINNNIQQYEQKLLQKLDNQIKALIFQISVQKLSIMMRFQSYQMINQYLIIFKSKIILPTKPSINFLKNKYQFHILQYIHNHQNNLELDLSINLFLKYFGLTLQNRTTVQFQNRLFDLGNQDRRAVRECIQDYYIQLYLKKVIISEDQLLHMLQLFPRSCALLVLFGTISANLSLKTAAFLKCIQLQRESTISIDILASLYLKQKNYLAAAKLFLKSLEVDLLNVKCYLGLAICLFCLVCRAVETKEGEQLQIIERCLIRINSYMQYLRIQDPSQNYHLLSFLRLLLNSESNSKFEAKLVLNSAQNFKKYRSSLLGELIAEATSNWGNLNIWKNESQIMIVNEYLEKLPFFSVTKSSELGKRILDKAIERIDDINENKKMIGKQILIKYISKIMNEIGISINLQLKQKIYNQQYFNKVIQSLKIIENLIIQQNLNTNDIRLLKRKLKGEIFDILFLKEYNRQQVNRLQIQLFTDVKYYQYLTRYNTKIPKLERQIAYWLLRDPSNQQLRTIYNGWLVGIRGQHIKKAKLSYKLQIINSYNESNDTEGCFRKLFLLYRDNTSLLIYIQHLWNCQGKRSQKNILTWLKQIIYLQNKLNIKDNNQLMIKLMRLKIQMIAYYYVYYNEIYNIKLQQYQLNKFNKLVLINKLMKGQNNWNQLSKYFKEIFDQFDWWILLSLISTLAQNYQLGERFQSIVQELENIVQCPRKKGFLLLVRIINIFSKSAETQNELVQQIVSLTNLAQICEGKISANSEVIIECIKALLASSWDEMENQLAAAAQTCKIVSYSDRVIINFFEVLKLYKSAESNPNEQGVIDSFYFMVDSMLAFVQQPTLRGFFLSLKGIIRTLNSLQQSKDRNLKMAILLDPSASNSLLGIRR